MNPITREKGELDLLCENTRITSINSLEDWQAEEMIENAGNDTTQISNACLKNIDKIVENWLETLNEGEWARLKTQNSLYGITIPNDWIKVWRHILKEPTLRDPEAASKRGRNLGSFTYVWNIWAKDSVDKYLNEMDKHLLQMVDDGYPYAEIGNEMVEKYGEEFWKPRKKDTKTTAAQVVNNYLYQKLPVKIARQELYDITQIELKRRKKKKEEKKEK